MFIDGISATGPLVVADAPPASDKDRPAAPNTGTAFIPAFRFEARFARGIIAFLHASIAPDFVRPAMVLFKADGPARDASETPNVCQVRATGRSSAPMRPNEWSRPSGGGEWEKT